MLRQGFLRLADPTGEAADLIEELGINVFDADGNMKEMHEVVSELENGLEGMDSQTRSAALSTIFGTQSTAGWSTVLERGSDELEKYTGELEDSEGAASDMAETMEDNAKGGLREFRSALEEAGIALSENLLPAVTDAIEWGTELARKFGELDDSTQENIVKMGLFAAAIGPVALIAGNLTTALGGLFRIGGSVAGMIGKAGGAGLAGRIGLLGATGGAPVALAIAGVAALAGGIYSLTRDKEELHDINLDVAQSLSDEHTEISQAAEAYQDLRNEARLNNDEFGELLDIKEELSKNPEGEALEELQSRYEELREKSGLTNEQLDEMIQHNNTIVENAPQTAEAHSSQGNAVAGVNEELEKYLDTLRETSLQEIELEKMKYEENKLIHLRDINEAKEREKELTEQIGMLSDLSNLSETEKSERLVEIADLKSNYLTTEEEIVELTKEEEVLQGLVKDGVAGTIDNLKEQMEDQREIIENAETELEKGQALDELYAEIHLKKLGINESGEEGIRLAEEQLEKLREERDELQKTLDKEGDITGELQDQIYEKGRLIGEHENILSLLNDEEFLTSEMIDNEQRREVAARHVNDVLTAQAGQLDRNNSKIEDGTGKARDMNAELGKDANKNVNITPNPSIADLNNRLGESVTKGVNLSVTGGSAGLAYAKGTDNHPGGPFIAGEKGWELGRLGNRWEMLNFGMYDRPRGYEVFPHNESKKILSALNNVPGYAGGARPTGEANRVTDALDTNAQVISLLRDIAAGIRAGQVIEIGGEIITQVVNENNATESLGRYF